jgi:hypothetical protein
MQQHAAWVASIKWLYGLYGLVRQSTKVSSRSAATSRTLLRLTLGCETALDALQKDGPGLALCYFALLRQL